MTVIEDDRVVEQLAPDASHEALGDAVLPRAPVAGARRFDAHGAYRPDHLLGEDRVAVEDQVPRSTFERERLPKLLADPVRGRVLRDVPVRAVPPAVAGDFSSHWVPESGAAGHLRRLPAAPAAPATVANDGPVGALIVVSTEAPDRARDEPP